VIAIKHVSLSNLGIDSTFRHNDKVQFFIESRSNLIS